MKPTKGYLITGPVVSIIVAGNAGAQALFNVSASPLQIGTKSFKIRKLLVRDNGTGGTKIHIGTGIAGAVVDIMPGLQTINHMDNSWEGPNELPDVEFFANAMIYADAVLGSTLDCQVTVEEIG